MRHILQEVRSRFDGEVMELGKRDEGADLKFGDPVQSGQLLAVVWSRELGEKKSELLDALSQQHLDTETLKRLEKLYQDGTIPEREYREQERAVENDRITVSRVLCTLQTWRVVADEIKEVEAESSRLIAGDVRLSEEQADRWARVELRSALDGVILERNIAVGDIVSNADDLFKVADLSRLRVLAYAYEEDLPSLDTLPVDSRRWVIGVPSISQGTAQQGTIEQIGHIIDPTQHTALVMGWVDNKDGRLRAGQFITASVDLPPPGNEVVLPASALIEKGGENLVFVQTKADPVYTQRNVSVSRQVGSNVCFHIVPPSGDSQGQVYGLKPGEQVVISGAVELQQTLTHLTASKPDITVQK
jgi:cobalt-zinc-cadmium efflux system membrane fusion protein